MSEHTKLELFLCNGVIVTVYYKGNIFDEIYDELSKQVFESFMINNYETEQIVIHGRSGEMVFSGMNKREMTNVAWEKVIGWNIISPED